MGSPNTEAGLQRGWGRNGHEAGRSLGSRRRGRSYPAEMANGSAGRPRSNSAPAPSSQYMMLSGQVPFQGASGQGGQSQAAEIMCKIREGRFSLAGEAWQGVSEEAKELVRGARLEAPGPGRAGEAGEARPCGSSAVAGGVPGSRVPIGGGWRRRAGFWGPRWAALGRSLHPRPPSTSSLAPRAPDCGPRQAAEARGAAGQLVAAGRQRALLAPAAHARRAGVLGARRALRAQRHLPGTRRAAAGGRRGGARVCAGGPGRAGPGPRTLSPPLPSYQAFNRGKREGFFLKSVENAPLAKRRKQKLRSAAAARRGSPAPAAAAKGAARRANGPLPPS